MIRECVTIHRGTNDRKATRIGHHCLLMTYVHVAHDCQIGNHVILASYTGLSGHVQIDDYAILEGKVAAQQFTHIGKHTFIGGASLIRKNIPPYIKAAREPLTFAGVNSVGLRRRGFSDKTIREIEDLKIQILDFIVIFSSHPPRRVKTQMSQKTPIFILA